MFLELPDKYVRVDEFPAEDADPTSSGFNGEALIQIPQPPAPPPRGLAGHARPADLARRRRWSGGPFRAGTRPPAPGPRPVLPRPPGSTWSAPAAPQPPAVAARTAGPGRLPRAMLPAGGGWLLDQAAAGRQWIRAARASPR